MKLETLTKEQQERLPEIRDKYISKFLNSDPINMDVAKNVIEFVYSLINEPMPQIIVATDPMDAQMIANELMKTKNTFYTYGTYLTIGWASWYAFYETFIEFGTVTPDNNPQYFKLREFIESNIYSTIEFDKAIVIVPKPQTISRNEIGLHNVNEPAIKWDGGYGQYYVNGRNLLDEHFKSVSNKTFTISDFANEGNEEVKSACIALMQEKFGDEYIVNFFRKNLSEVDTYTNKKDDHFMEGTTKGMNVGVYTLFKGEINGENIAYVRCYCPSTDRMFFLGVDSSYKNAKDAIASLYRIPAKLKNHIKSISRQGERFSTILTEKGKEVLSSLSEAEVANVSGLSGEDYFKLMQYEF